MPKRDVYDIVLLGSVDPGIHAVADLDQIIATGNHTLAEQEPSGELEVIAWSTHRYSHGARHPLRDKAYLHRFFRRQLIAA
jgi:hypothetical protein